MSSRLTSLDSPSGLVAFAAAVDARSFSAASRELGLSASAVGKAIERLELRLGKRLLNRTTRALSLTAEGEVLYRHVVDIVRNLNEAEHELHLLEHAPRGPLKIRLPTVIGRRIVLPAMFDFHERFPDVMLSLSLDDRRLDLIEEGYDVALWLGELADSSLHARRLGPLPLATFAAPGYLSRHGIPITPAELAGHHCIHYQATRSGRVEAWLFEGCTPFRSPAPVTILNDEEAIAAAAIAGLGLAQTPAYLVADEIAAGRLQPVLVSHAVERGSVSLVWPQMLGKVPRVRVFIDFIAARITAQLYGQSANAA
ncbi:LysR family transcriptional regulator [Stenotrophomonas sp. SY1]|uniref:LysR family transcriptional regulator n=1 Tax=Stenotrophomonas sp. SY1 TaxID=477235 RepID=UPI001E32A88A|nr:LysR family transcriptional regulator [Stenotrophomonas sp. SY1]MCD9087481.1 LysR family transcriptional regulator [Stenotrophomonas sp. SY1]